MSWKPIVAASSPLATCSRPDPVMAKEDLMVLDGTIDEILPDGRFGVTLENAHRIIA